jgi:hypothetical protein
MKRSDVFEPLEPPPHGWTRMKARLGERRARRWPIAVAAAAAVVLAVLLPKPGPRPGSDVEAALRGAMLDVPGEPLRVKRGAAQRLPSSDPNVLFYRVAVLNADEAPPED